MTKGSTEDVFAAPMPRLDRAGVEAARLVRVAREQLVAGSPSVTIALLAEARDVEEATARQMVTRRRAAGRLITVEYNGTVLVPSFQFDKAYDPVPEVGDVIEDLTGIGMSGWAIWRWFTVEDPWIERRPVDLIEAGDCDTLRGAARRVAPVRVAAAT